MFMTCLCTVNTVIKGGKSHFLKINLLYLRRREQVKFIILYRVIIYSLVLCIRFLGVREEFCLQ